MHLSAGLQLYVAHEYTYQPENPPLPRLVFALAPWLGGVKFEKEEIIPTQLQRVFYSNDRYKTNLVLARCGNLLFFAIACFAVWAWGRRELGDSGAAVAIFLFTFQPMVLGHAGLATHDMAATAGTALSLWMFIRWLDESTIRRAMLFGAAFGFAILCKFSCIGYVPAACLAVYLVRVIRDRNLRAPWKSILPAALVATAVVWTGYAFSYETFIAGVKGLASINSAGTHYNFLFGEIRTDGFRFYFPIALALKSTIASLLLALGARKHFEPLAATLAILAVAMPSNLDLGVRYVLPLYAPLSVAAAGTALALWSSRRWIAVALLAWHGATSLAAHPDELPYFNVLAGRAPWTILADSNIDWGQDVLRLRRVAREKKIENIGIDVFGWHDYGKLGFPPSYRLLPMVPTQGWVAVSEHLYIMRKYDWLRGRPYERVGKSIRLYYIQ
jgi:4-amino-4-deoxy-L-arabinose transferase-like glycosyltransferase